MSASEKGALTAAGPVVVERPRPSRQPQLGSPPPLAEDVGSARAVSRSGSVCEMQQPGSLQCSRTSRRIHVPIGSPVASLCIHARCISSALISTFLGYFPNGTRSYFGRSIGQISDDK